MTASQLDFRSDNVWGASPEILNALSQANDGSAAAYGGDDWTCRLERRLAEIFACDLSVFPVGTGSAANSLALSVIAPPWGVIYCHKQAHVQVDECGGPEFFTGGAKLLPLEGRRGKLDSEELERAIFGAGAVHHAQPAGLTVAQASECGRVYRPEELRVLSDVCKANKLTFHMDGARFANALVALDATPAETTWKAGIDLLSFGGTKNGCIAGEALVVFNPRLAETLAFRRKRAGQLFSKMRFFSAQLLAYLERNLWCSNARKANTAAAALAQGLVQKGARLAFPVEANEVFARLPPALAKELNERGFLFYDWPAAGPEGYRFVTSFQSDAAAIEAALGSC
ncbi:MAG: low specificity L-threonine aldolase [Rhodospirillales bacterium]|nr:low specificity L-threonine aldolase [Rhodospirillales bacterium]